MLKDIENKAVVEKETKTTKKEQALRDVCLRNKTVIEGKVYPAGLNKLTEEQYNLVKRFL